MPHEPKKRHSRARQGKRRASIKFTPVNVTTCSNCGNKIEFHTVCANCGYYRGVKVLVKTQEPKQSA